jgi:hypothetical protein
MGAVLDVDTGQRAHGGHGLLLAVRPGQFNTTTPCRNCGYLMEWVWHKWVPRRQEDTS